MAKSSKTSARHLKPAERKVVVLNLRRQGFSYTEISARVGISAPAAYRIVKKEMQKLAEKAEEQAEEIRKLELQRLDELFKQYYPMALQGDKAALDRVLKIMERRAKLLGLDAPEKIDANITEKQVFKIGNMEIEF